MQILWFKLSDIKGIFVKIRLRIHVLFEEIAAIISVQLGCKLMSDLSLAIRRLDPMM